MSDRDFRLPPTIRPRRYAIDIDVDLDNWRFRGREDIDIDIKEATSSLTLHAVELDISDVHLTLADRRVLSATLTWDPEAETVTLHLGETIPPGPAALALAFDGEIRARLRGFYRSEKDGRRYAATQFEAADARRAFPCFDEPAFKARFALTLTMPPGVVAIANGAIEEEHTVPGGRTRVRFAETPPISSYLVAYTVGPYEATAPACTPSGVPVRVFLPQGMADKGTYAREAHVRSLAYLEDYTAIPYPYGKVDAIGVPDFEAGAMENPGAITYRLTAIAADPNRASLPAQKGIFYTAAHELTHMWWGDLVTMSWWDDLWLNESFATFVGYTVVADLMPEWSMWRDFVATLTRPFNLDALLSTHPISFEVRNAKQATERFDVITYWKGAGVVRMVERFLGADAFRAGVRAYLNRYREGNATADDFWRELSQTSGRDVATVANAWIRHPGHPLVRISTAATDDALSLTLRQERFLADPAAKPQTAATLWPIPLVIKYGTATDVREERVLLDAPEATVTLPGARWCFPNGDGAGFYRFALDDAALAPLVAVVQSSLTAPERLVLVANQWALVKAGRVPMPQFFALLEGFRSECDRAVLAAIAERLFWLGTHVASDEAHPALAQFVAGFFAPALDAFGWDPTPQESGDDRLRRATVIGALGDLARVPTVVATARERLERYLRDPATLDTNLVSVVVGIAARTGDAALFARYLERKQAATRDPEEEQRFLLGLTAFEDAALIERTLRLTLTDAVRPQDRAHLLAALLGQRAARAAAWNFVRVHWRELVERMDPMLQQNLVRALAQLTPEPMATEVREFLPRRATGETRETIAQAVEQLAIDAAACTRLRPALGVTLARSA